jgi:hypothetical protein
MIFYEIEREGTAEYVVKTLFKPFTRKGGKEP